MLTVSVIIPIYNAARFVEQAVASALDQPEVAEVLLVEDGSQDGSLAVCEALAESQGRVRLLRHPNGENRGAAETRSLGVREARCPFVAFLDADDYYLPGRFGPAKRVFAKHPDADGVYDAVGTHFENEQMRRWWAEQGRPELSTVTPGIEPEHLFEAIVTSRRFHTNGILVKRSLFDRTGLFDAELRMTQDSAMWIKMAAVGRLVGGSLDQPVAMRRLHGDNRIVQQTREHRKYAFLMWRTLGRWAAEESLAEDRQRTLLLGQLGRWRQLDAAQRMDVAGHVSDLRFFSGMLWRQPGLLWHRSFWRQVRRWCGSGRMAGLARLLLRRPGRQAVSGEGA